MQKINEKSDLETCNHMIHKITDGIPCIRDRTDFCYCCGEEVLGDYPHEEVNHPGLITFPMECIRSAAQLCNENAAQKERLKRIKRMRNGGASNKTNRQQEFDVEDITGQREEVLMKMDEIILTT